MADKIRAILVDDEPLATESLKQVLADFAEIQVVAECANGFEAVQAVHKLRPDLLFLDIQMPRLDGFDVVELLGKEAPFIIFVTAYDEYALRAFEAQALDYLLKPVKRERLEQAVARVKEQIDRKTPQAVAKLIDMHQGDLAPLPRVLIRDGTDVTIVPSEEIVYIEAQDDYVGIFTAEKSYLKYDSMDNLGRKLDARTFCRIHRSYLLNINFLSKIEPYTKDSKIVKLKDGRTLPLSKSGYNRLLDLL